MQFLVDPEVNWKHPVVWVTGLAATLASGSVILLFLFLVVQGFPVFAEFGFGFFSGGDWLPGESYSVLPLVYGSLIVTALALVWVMPPALGCALYSSEYLPPSWRRVVKAMMELLSGVPGILFGLLGVSFLAVWVKDIFGLIDGNTLLTASFLLAAMILPTIMTLAEDALRAVPSEYRETARALGLTSSEITFGVVLPQALPGVAGAVLLGLGRAMGETVAVMLVIGGLDLIPEPWFDITQPGQSIPSKLGREAAEALGSGMHWNALIASGLVLFLMVIVISLIGTRLLKRKTA
ncbi:MAG: phosphate ABC transporter permease subunit PstC [Candidatus Nitronauta litoralis]|uniref:Phosphate transport system permease protein n=1 Tax=Candidatus Nitronauta litoralis TaxID=2705533 RepID=A0A7T0G0U1_9BACT|nr:MAG: phosphate ABC transporter permease subunit PstC [Candidatus Nitronauta litoralis]